MDEAFMSRVAERIAAATEAVSSFSPTADPGKLPALQTMDEWMASHSPDARHRCVDCKAPLVEGSANICVACGRPLPPRLAVRREEFSFDKSLAKKRFYESVHLEDCQDTSSDTTELQEASSSGMETIANGHRQQQSRWTTGIEVGIVERNLQGGERGKTIVSDASDNIIPAPAESLSNPLKEAAEEDEYIWGSADADDFGSRAWTQQLAGGSGGDPKELSVADNSAINSATKTLGQTLSTDQNEFSFAVASSSADQSVAPSVEIDFDFFFPPGGNSVNETRGEEGETAGPSTSKESLGQSVGPHFHDFFQVSPPVAGEQSRDPKVQSPDPFLLVGSTGQTVKENFDDFFQVSPDSTDQSHRHNEETAVPYSAEESRSYNIETDFDDFFQGPPKSVDQSRGLNGETSVPHTAEESSSHIIGTDFDGFFNGVPGSADLSRGPNVKTLSPHAEEESKARDGEADFDDFFEAAPISGDGSKVETTVPHVNEAFSVHREEPYFDFFFENSAQSVNQSRGQNVETAIPHLPEKSSGLNVETDFGFFFQPGPAQVDQSSTPKVQPGAFLPAMESIGQKSDNQFGDFFQVTVKSADEDHAQNVEMLFPVSAESAKVAIPVPLTVEDDQDGEADFDDFFQAAPVPADPSPAQNKDDAGHNSIEGLVRQAIKTDFDSFFQASPNSAKGSGGHNTGTDFDYFFQTPIKSDRGQDPHAQPGVPNIQAESKSKTMEPDFDEFFQAANDSINHSQGQKVKTVATSLVEESVGQNGETQFEDFFKAAPHSIGQSNGNNKEAHFDFFQVTPFHGKESSGKNASTGSHGFFAGVPHSSEKPLGESERRDFDPFFQVSPWSMDKSLDQNGTTDSSDGDFDDFVQAAPQSADQVVAPSQKTEVDSFQATPRLVDKSQQSLTEDFDDFFQAAPKTAEKTPDANTKTEFEFLKASPQSADKSRYKPESADFSDLFQVAPARTEVPKLPSTPSGLFVLGNGSGQIAGASLTSTLTEGRSNNGETPKQLEGRHSPQSPLQGHLEPPTNTPNVLSDLSFRLADQLVITDEAATNMWSFN